MGWIHEGLNGRDDSPAPVCQTHGTPKEYVEWGGGWRCHACDADDIAASRSAEADRALQRAAELARVRALPAADAGTVLWDGYRAVPLSARLAESPTATTHLDGGRVWFVAPDGHFWAELVASAEQIAEDAEEQRREAAREASHRERMVAWAAERAAKESAEKAKQQATRGLRNFTRRSR